MLMFLKWPVTMGGIGGDLVTPHLIGVLMCIMVRVMEDREL